MNTRLGPAELHRLLGSRRPPRLLDVRAAAEFEHAHIVGAYHVPLHLLGEHAAEIRTVDEPGIVLVCQSGQRARRADDVLRHAGMAGLQVLDGGMAAWQQAGLPVARVTARVSIERQVRILAGTLVAAGGAAALFANPWWAVVPLAVGSGLVVAGVTDTCGMGLLLARLPFNRAASSCDTDAMVRRFLLHAADPPR